MLIDFFKSDCQGTTEQQTFGLCDDPALKFLESNTVNPYARKEGYVANKQRPFFNNGVETIAAEFKDDTGFVLRIRRDIEI